MHTYECACALCKKRTFPLTRSVARLMYSYHTYSMVEQSVFILVSEIKRTQNKNNVLMNGFEGVELVTSHFSVELWIMMARLTSVDYTPQVSPVTD
jgi:hypothetical protein